MLRLCQDRVSRCYVGGSQWYEDDGKIEATTQIQDQYKETVYDRYLLGGRSYCTKEIDLGRELCAWGWQLTLVAVDRNLKTGRANHPRSALAKILTASIDLWMIARVWGKLLWRWCGVC